MKESWRLHSRKVYKKLEGKVERSKKSPNHQNSKLSLDKVFLLVEDLKIKGE